MASSQPHVLVLGGTTEATALCRAMSDRGISGLVSYAGRVARPVRQPLPQRIGGFGGTDGLSAFIIEEKITHLVDATHPFAEQMSHNASVAAAQTGVPMVALTRAPWKPVAGDRWHHVGSTEAAVAALNRKASRVMLAIGRQTLSAFAENPQHFYLLRLVDPPDSPPPFPDHHAVVDRGPFTEDADRALLADHDIDLVVSKNSGGDGAYAKIAAARALGLPVIMIERPALPARTEMFAVGDVLDWIDHSGTPRGV